MNVNGCTLQSVCLNRMQSLPTGRRRRIDVNGVSLIDLKAEIARRQSEVKTRATTIPNVTGAVLKRAGDGSGVNVLLRRPPSPFQKLKAKEEVFGAKGATEEDTDWERARRNLEAKARLYEALKQAAITHSKEGDDDDDRAPLVDFGRKAVEEKQCITDSSDEDADEDRSGPCQARPFSRVTAEPVSIPEGPVTYAHLRQGEVRDHGTGFYAFSADAEQRLAEQAALRELRRRTERARERVEEERAKRTVAMGRRLAQLRARKGLPDVATAAANLLEKNVAPSQPSPTPPSPPPPVSEGAIGEQLCSDDLDIASMLRRLRDEAEVKQAAAAAAIASTTATGSPLKDTTLPSNAPTPLSRKRPTREWDRGKSFISPPPKSRFTTYTQKLTDERNPEFAPPDFYS
ncbi:Coiled-coil domain-containing protein [Echinococcus granulosus]|nr:Coiled-coil domain-containing protein [Echinococcus granulosus]